MIEDIVCVILAGGKSSRMGRDKALLPFGGYSSLAEYQYRRMQKIFKSVYISTKESKFDFDANLILDRYAKHSPMHALASIFETINSKDIFLLAVDMPFFDNELIEPLLKYYKKDKNSQIICYKTKNLEPLSAIYRRDIKSSIDKMIAESNFKLQHLLTNTPTCIIFSQNVTKFSNLNYYNDYLKSI